MIFSGNALRSTGRRISTYGAQPDIAATLLGQLGIESKDFLFSRDLLADINEPYAFYSSPNDFAISDSTGTTVVDIATGAVKGNEAQATKAKAYLQNLYNYLDSI